MELQEQAKEWLTKEQWYDLNCIPYLEQWHHSCTLCFLSPSRIHMKNTWNGNRRCIGTFCTMKETRGAFICYDRILLRNTVVRRRITFYTMIDWSIKYWFQHKHPPQWTCYWSTSFLLYNDMIWIVEYPLLSSLLIPIQKCIPYNRWCMCLGETLLLCWNSEFQSSCIGVLGP